jgi:hypothetical protein
MSSLELPENYRSVPSVIRAARAVLRSTKGGKLSLPESMRVVDIEPLFGVSSSAEVCISSVCPCLFGSFH